MPRRIAHSRLPFALVVLLTLTSHRAVAGGIGVSQPAEPESASVFGNHSAIWNIYRTPAVRNALGHRDLEFLWSPTYNALGKPIVSAGDTAENDLDRYGKTICETHHNPFGFGLSDIQLVYNYLNFAGAAYSTIPSLPGFICAIPDTAFPELGGIRHIYGTPDKDHIDTYLYYPTLDTGGSNYGKTPSDFLSANEDTSTGHTLDTLDVLHWNSVQVPGPDTSQVGKTGASAWTRPDTLQNWGFDHEFQHAFNFARGQARVSTEMFSSAAEALGGELPEPVYADVPYTWSLTMNYPPGNYQAWRSFTAYLAYNFRGTDTTQAGISDDLLWRWARIGDHTLRGLALALNDSVCAECATKSYFAGLDDNGRLQALIHNWRIANYVNNDTLGEHQYGFPPQFGFVPSRDIGAWQNVDGLASDDSISIPPDTTLSSTTREVSITDTRYTKTTGGVVALAPMALQMFGAEYWVIHADSTLSSGTRDLVVDVSPDAALGGSFHHNPPNDVGGHNCWSFDFSDGRLMATIVGYSGPTDSLTLPNYLWRHPEYAKLATAVRSVVVDSLSGAVTAVLPNFGSTYEAALVVITLNDGPTGTASGTINYAGAQVLPYRLSLAVRKAPYDSLSPRLVEASSGESDDFATWAPAGDKLGFQSTIGSISPYEQIYTKGFDGLPAARLVTPVQDFDQEFPDWSPRGDFVAFSQDSGGGQCDVWTFRVGVANSAQRLTWHRGHADWPAFSPNGQQIAYMQQNAGSDSLNHTWQVRKMNLDGSGDVLVGWVGTQTLPRALRWSPDGAWLYYTVNDSLIAMSVASGSRALRYAALQSPSTSFDLPLGAGPIVFEQPGEADACDDPFQTFVRIATCDTARHDIRARFYQHSAQMHNPRWSFDNTHVAYGSDQDSPGDVDLFVAQATYDHAPQFVGLQDQSFAACQAFTLGLQATDADGDPISYQMVDAPGGTLTGSTYHWAFPVVGTYFVVFRAKDPYGGVANQVVRFDVFDDGSCYGGMMAGGGDAGGGFSMKRTGSTSLQTSKAAASPVENSLLNGAASGVSTRDCYRLQTSPVVGSGNCALFLRQRGRSGSALNGARLTAVDHPVGTSVWMDQGEVLCGTRVPPVSATSAGRDVTAQVSGGDMLSLAAGQLVTVALGDSGRPSPVVIEARGQSGDPDASGLLVAIPDNEGGWRAVRHCWARQQFDELAIDSLAASSVRVTAVSAADIRFIGRVAVSGGTPVVQAATLLHAVRGDDDVAASIGSTDSSAVMLAGGDSLALTFASPASSDSLVRDWFLTVVAAPLSANQVSQARLRGSQRNLPRVFALRQNQPNPFSALTHINFELPVGSPVVIEVFDAQGRHVRKLTSGSFAAGYHVADWDHRSDAGDLVRPGVYLYRMRAGRFRAQRKMILLPR